MARRELRQFGLARALSKLGHCSRSRGFQLVRDGRVRLNGKVVRNPEFPVHLEKDRIAVDGIQVEAENRVYLMMNKPRGVITTAADEKGRDTVYAHLEASIPWVGPVGRLDKASEGLLLLTNDSEWAARIASPESHLDKVYHVHIRVEPDEALVDRLLKGIRTQDEVLRVKQAKILRRGSKNCWLEIVLDEGKNRQIRRIFEALGIEVLRLVRVAIGPLPLGTLRKGEVRKLTPPEKQSLDAAMK